MTIAVTQTYRTVVVMAADLDMTIQIQEVHGWEFVTAFPAVIEADEHVYAGEGDAPDDARSDTNGDTNGDTSDRADYVIIFRKRHDRQRQAAFYS